MAKKSKPLNLDFLDKIFDAHRKIKEVPYFGASTQDVKALAFMFCTYKILSDLK